MERIAIVIPVFNEEANLPETIRQLEDLTRRSEPEFEVVFVNDGSTDRTRELLSRINHPGFTVIHHPVNRGYGASLKTGIGISTAPYICITDADGTYPNEQIPDLFHEMKRVDASMVVGARTGKIVKIPLFRKVAKGILNRLANYLAGTTIPDINSGLRIMKREDIRRFMNILPDGFSFTTTITLAMLTNNLRVQFLPINYYERGGKSKIRPFYDTLNFLQLIIRTCLYFKPLQVFIPMSGLLLVCAIMVAVVSWLVTDRIMDVTFGVLVMTSVLVLAIGMLADLIDKRLP
ncbi:MAG: glycosyltransferase family 2 protein [Thermodesulfobacteriota bacterium]